MNPSPLNPARALILIELTLIGPMLFVFCNTIVGLNVLVFVIWLMLVACELATATLTLAFTKSLSFMIGYAETDPIIPTAAMKVSTRITRLLFKFSPPTYLHNFVIHNSIFVLQIVVM